MRDIECKRSSNIGGRWQDSGGSYKWRDRAKDGRATKVENFEKGRKGNWLTARQGSDTHFRFKSRSVQSLEAAIKRFQNIETFSARTFFFRRFFWTFLFCAEWDKFFRSQMPGGVSKTHLEALWRAKRAGSFPQFPQRATVISRFVY